VAAASRAGTDTRPLAPIFQQASLWMGSGVTPRREPEVTVVTAELETADFRLRVTALTFKAARPAARIGVA
jgi:hypothetical protein